MCGERVISDLWELRLWPHTQAGHQSNASQCSCHNFQHHHRHNSHNIDLDPCCGLGPSDSVVNYFYSYGHIVRLTKATSPMHHNFIAIIFNIITIIIIIATILFNNELGDNLWPCDLLQSSCCQIYKTVVNNAWHVF